MATVYVDGTKVGGVEDGTTWATAWNGAAGMQTALDAAAAGANTFYIRNTFTLTAAIDIDTQGGDRTNNEWWDIIGCDGAGDELANGSYVQFDANGGAYPVFKVLSSNNTVDGAGNVDNIRFKHIWAYNTSKAAGMDGFQVANTAAGYNYVLDNCKVTDCSDGISSTTANVNHVMCLSCVIAACSGDCIQITGRGTYISKCHLTAAGSVR